MNTFFTYLGRHKFSISIGTIMLLLGLGVGHLLFHNIYISPTIADTHNCTDYPFINQTLDCGSIDENISRIRNIDTKIRSIIDEEKTKNHIIRASVFYRDLTTRRWFGIDDTANFYGASLLKLPLAIIYFKFAEVAPDILLQKFSLLEENRDEKEAFPSQKKLLIPGNTYTVQQLIEGMLIDSDNNPVTLLNNHIDPVFRTTILHDLGIEDSGSSSNSPDRYVNVRLYANILRALYNSSYLNLTYSEKILDYLSRSTFANGIGAAIPQNIPVAHKFGEATSYAADGSVSSRILHDCGIVYSPNNPYIICIMTEGRDFTNMSEVIKRITQATFQLEY